MKRHLGVSYPTAHGMLMTIRDFMDALEEGKKIEGIVEMDETFVGGKPRSAAIRGLSKDEMKFLDKKIKTAKKDGFDINDGTKTNRKYPAVGTKRGRGTKKTPVVGMVSREGDVIVKVMNKLTYRELKKMVQKHVNEEDSLLITDKYKGYNRMSQIIDHISIDHKKAWSYNGIDTNTIEGFWASIKRAITGTYHQVSLKYLHLYVVEMAYKYNNRHDNDAMFHAMVKAAFSEN